MKKCFLFICCTMFVLIGRAENVQTVELKLKAGLTMKIEVCTDDIFRVQITPHKECREALLERYNILKTDWKKVPVTIKKKGVSEIIQTATCKMVINTDNGAISVYDKKGNVKVKDVTFLSSSNEICTSLGNVINEEFRNLKVLKNNGIIGDDANKNKKSNAETGDYKNNCVLRIPVQNDERFYGGGSTSRKHIQHRGELLRIHATYQNTEIPQPFMLSSNGWGIFNNTTRKHFYDIGKTQKKYFYVYNTLDEADFYLMFGNKMPDIIDHYTLITGRPYILPRWAYGVSFGGNILENQNDLMTDALRFREGKYPCDMFWVEPQWMAKRYDFSTEKTWDYKKFMAEPYWMDKQYPKTEHQNLFIGRLHGMGFKFCLWLCIEHDMSIQAEDEIVDKTGKALSGKSHWFDHLRRFIDVGVDGFKLDPARTMDEHPDWKYYNGLTDIDMHNMNQILLPKQMQTVFRKDKGVRDFQHYTAGWAGTQHFGASTSGDNGGGKTALFDQLNLGLSGFLNTSCDVMGGVKKEMEGLHFGTFLPWEQIDSWYDVLHPWFFPQKEKETYSSYLRLRHDLNPYIYSAAIEGNRTGMPIVRAMPLVFPDDKNVQDMAYQYMFGNNLLVGVYSDSIYIPKGEWIDYWTGEVLTGEKYIYHKVPENRGGLLFIRNGSIIPYQPSMQYIGEQPLDTLILKVFPKGKATYTLYEDDGKTFDYEKGETAITPMECIQDGNETKITIYPVTGTYKGVYESRTYKMQIRYANRPNVVLVNGEEVTGWTYDKGYIMVSVYQKDVRKELYVTVKG